MLRGGAYPNGGSGRRVRLRLIVTGRARVPLHSVRLHCILWDFICTFSEFVIVFPPVQMARLVFDFNGKDKNMGCTCKDPERVYDHGPQPELFYGE